MLTEKLSWRSWDLILTGIRKIYSFKFELNVFLIFSKLLWFWSEVTNQCLPGENVLIGSFEISVYWVLILIRWLGEGCRGRPLSGGTRGWHMKNLLLQQLDIPWGTVAYEEPTLEQGESVREKEQQRETTIFLIHSSSTPHPLCWGQRAVEWEVKEWNWAGKGSGKGVVLMFLFASHYPNIF